MFPLVFHIWQSYFFPNANITLTDAYICSYCLNLCYYNNLSYYMHMAAYVLSIISYFCTIFKLWEIHMHTYALVMLTTHNILLLLTKISENKIIYILHNYDTYYICDTTEVCIYNIVCNCLYHLLLLPFTFTLLLFTMITFAIFVLFHIVLHHFFHFSAISRHF